MLSMLWCAEQCPGAEQAGCAGGWKYDLKSTAHHCCAEARQLSGGGSGSQRRRSAKTATRHRCASGKRIMPAGPKCSALSCVLSDCMCIAACSSHAPQKSSRSKAARQRAGDRQQRGASWWQPINAMGKLTMNKAAHGNGLRAKLKNRVAKQCVQVRDTTGQCAASPA